MSQHYSNPRRESDPHALPDVETFHTAYAYCTQCQSLSTDVDASGHANCTDCGHTTRATKAAWFWWSCFPGCLPDSEPFGPFATEAEALADARVNVDEEITE